MRFYRVGYYSYEESPFTYLTHEVAFDQEEFLQLVAEAAVAVVSAWASLAPDFSEEKDNTYGFGRCSSLTRYSDLSLSIPAYLISKKGFSSLPLTASVEFDGWASVVEPNPGGLGFPLSQNGNNQMVTSRLISEGLGEPIYVKNQQIEDFLREEYDREAKSE